MAQRAQPLSLVAIIKLGTLRRQTSFRGGKVGMTSSQDGPYGLGCTRATMLGTEGSETARWSKSFKTEPSSDCSLQLDCMKPESLVMAYQLRRREYVPRPCTHRPSHHESRLYPKSPVKGAEGMAGDWDEVVTR